MASNLENIGHESETCQELVQSLITIEEVQGFKAVFA
jgi:hypothetical protein